MTYRDSTPFVSVIAPVLNRESILKHFHHELEKTMTNKDVDWEIIYIDDGSNDGSWRIIEQLVTSSIRVRAIRLSRTFGQHAAISAGLQCVENSSVVLIDVDVDSRVDAICALIDAVKMGTDLAVACEKHEKTGWKLQKTLASRLVHRGLVEAGSVNLPTKGFQPTSLRALSRQMVHAIKEYGEYGIIFGPLSMSLGFNLKLIELSPKTKSTIPSQSGYSFFDRIILSLRIWIRYSRRPPKSPFILGALVIFGTILFVIFAAFSFFIAGGNPLSAAAWLAVIQLMGLGVIIFLLSLQLSIGFEIFREVLKRPRYHIQEKIDHLQSK